MLTTRKKWDEIQKGEEARALVPALTPSIQRALSFLDGDYWGDGQYWVGTQIPADAVNRSKMEEELKRTFTPQPLVSECVERFVAALTQQEPSWAWVLKRSLKPDEKPTSDEIELLARVNDAQGDWWDKRRGHEITGQFARGLVGLGAAFWRHWVPSGLLSEGTNGKQLQVKSWEAALSKIWMEVPPLESVSIALHKDRMETGSVFTYTAQNEKGEDEARVEVSFVDETLEDTPLTIVRILDDEKIVDEVEQQCGGELYVDGAELAPLVTEAIARNQNALNVISTMLLHNGNLAMHRQRDFFNVQRPTAEVADASAPGGKKRVDVPLQIGATAANFHVGVPYEDEQGNRKFASGSLVITDPVDPTPLIAAKAQFEEAIYKAFSQLFVLMGDDATASALSRVVAKVEFVEKCKRFRPAIEGVLRSRLRAVTYLAAHLANETVLLKRLDGLRVRVDVRVTPPPLSPDERRVVVELYKAGLLSRETAMLMLGVEDVDGETQNMESDPVLKLEIELKRAQIMQTLTAAGAGIGAAARVAGFEEEDAKRLEKTDFVDEDSENQNDG